MIEKFGILTFDSTHHAIKAENDLIREGIQTKTIPTPRDITLSCGIAIRISPDDIEKIKGLLEEGKLTYKELHLLTIEDGKRNLDKLV